jgi:hypothetical protein
MGKDILAHLDFQIRVDFESSIKDSKIVLQVDLIGTNVWEFR